MTWTIPQLQYLMDNAGLEPIKAICREIKQPVEQARAMAVAFGIDIRFYERELGWCPTCATYRTIEPDCRVCELKGQLEALKRDNLEAFRQLSKAEQVKHLARDAAREETKLPRPKRPNLTGLSKFERDKAEEKYDIELERCLIAELEAEKDRIKHETFRMRGKHEDSAR